MEVPACSAPCPACLGSSPRNRDREMTDKSKAELQAEGWVFSGSQATADGAGNAAAASSKPGAAHFYGSAGVSEEESEGERLLGIVVQHGLQVAQEVLDTMAVDGRPTVQAKGCSAIAILAEKDAGRAAVLDANAVFAVTKAMEVLAAAAQVQASGCSALANLCQGDGAAAVLEGGGLEAVLAAMAAHASEPAVQLKGCLALGNIAFGAEGEARAVERGGVGAIASCLRAHGADAKAVISATSRLHLTEAFEPHSAASRLHLRCARRRAMRSPISLRARRA